MKTSARLDIQVYVECPHCEAYLNLLDERDTGGYAENDEGQVLNQAFPDDGNWSRAHQDFSIVDVTCSQCDKEFDVEKLEW